MSGNGDSSNFIPFTKAERIQQLADIDKKIVNLLRCTGQAVQSLGKKESHDEDTVMTDTEPARQFESSMAEFLRTLQQINIGMKRQIRGLDEAGIISLEKTSGITKEEGVETLQSNTRNRLLEPDGSGKIGGLDVGWLNSRSNKVEKDMEADLWRETENILRRLTAHQQQEAASAMSTT